MTRRAHGLLGVLAVAAALHGCAESEAPAVTAPPVQAEQYVDVGGYVIHFNALGTTVLTPEVARAYGITRSQNRAMLNITVMKKRGENALLEPSLAKVDASAPNLAGQRRDLEMRLIEDKDAKYYVGFVRVTNEETFEFKAHVTPPGFQQPIEIAFRRQFFVDD